MARPHCAILSRSGRSRRGRRWEQPGESTRISSLHSADPMAWRIDEALHTDVACDDQFPGAIWAKHAQLTTQAIQQRGAPCAQEEGEQNVFKIQAYGKNALGRACRSCIGDSVSTDQRVFKHPKPGNVRFRRGRIIEYF